MTSVTLCGTRSQTRAGSGSLLYCSKTRRMCTSVGVIRRTSERSSVGMTEDVYQSLKFKRGFSELSRAKQQKPSFLTDLSNI